MVGQDSDPYVYPGTVYVLKNKLNIIDAERLDNAESYFHNFRYQQLQPLFPAGKFDYDHLKAVHRHLFQDLYEWAGQERTINISKNDSGFAKTQFIQPYANKVFGEIKDQGYLRGLTRDGFAQLGAHYYSEINAIHPFREGNGRSLRAFYDQLANNAGYALRWSKTTQQQHTDAVRQSFHSDPEQLRKLFLSITEPLSRQPSRFEQLQTRRKDTDLER